jgi:hypothetical protein
VSGPPGPQQPPPGPPQQPGGRDPRRYTAVITTAVLAVIWVLIVIEYNGGPQLTYGLSTPLLRPSLLMLPAILLLVPYGLPRRQGVRAAVSGLLYGSLFGAGLAVGFGVGLAPLGLVGDDGDTVAAIQAILTLFGALSAIGGGVAVLAVGSARNVARRVDRMRLVLPAVIGLGSGFVALSDSGLASDVFYSTFSSSESLGDVVRYSAFAVGGSLLVTVAAVIICLARGTRERATTAYHVATGVALLIGGTLVAYAGYLGYVSATGG